MEDDLPSTCASTINNGVAMFKHCLPALFLLAFPLAASAAQEAPLPQLASPARAVLSPSLATLFVHGSIPVEMIGGAPSIRILLPANAADLQIKLEGAQILRMTQRAVIGAPDGGLSRERARMEKEIAELEGRSKAILARIEYGAEDISRGIDIQALHVENAGIKKQIKTLQETLKAYPESMERRTLVTAALAEAAGVKKQASSLQGSTVQPGASIEAEYSYKIPDCSWRPEYNIACSPQDDGKGTIRVRLEAVVQQSSCFDWDGTVIQLVTTGTGSGVRPPSLRSWNIGQEASQVRERRRSMEDGAAASGAMMAAVPVMERNAEPKKPAVADLSGAFASWIPAMRGLAQGESRILLHSAEWKEDIVWKVRPLNSDARVFLCAEHELETGVAWPAGPSRLSLDGAAIGTDTFSPRKGKVALSFGHDPRVQLLARTEPRKSGTQGFIGKDKIWEWAWQYTVRNDRETPVRVEVERPLPRSVNKDVKVEYTSAPAAREGKSELVWELDVPPHQSAVIEHGVKVTAPEKLSIITPVAP